MKFVQIKIFAFLLVLLSLSFAKTPVRTECIENEISLQCKMEKSEEKVDYQFCCLNTINSQLRLKKDDKQIVKNLHNLPEYKVSYRIGLKDDFDDIVFYQSNSMK